MVGGAAIGPSSRSSPIRKIRDFENLSELFAKKYKKLPKAGFEVVWSRNPDFLNPDGVDFFIIQT